MSKFKQKSPVVDALVWEGDNEEEVKAFMPKGSPPALFTKDGTVDLWTGYGIIRAQVGQFIIKEEDGTLGVVRPESFVNAYEVIEETDGDGRARYHDAEKRKAELDRQLKEGHHGQA